MKQNCDVARDLMPLVLDGAASGESARLVREHLTECPSCAEYYSGMQAALDAGPAHGQEEQRAFDQAARRLRRRRLRRIWLGLLLGAVVGFGLTLGGLWGWARLTQDYQTPQYYGEYGIYLSRLATGSVALSIDYRGSSLLSGIDVTEVVDEVSGERVLYVCNKRSLLKQYMEQPNRNYSFMTLTAAALEEFGELRQGTPEEYLVLWQRGGQIPAASQQMEAYFALEEQRSAIALYETKDGKAFAPTYEEGQRLEELTRRQQELWDTVPEWQ